MLFVPDTPAEGWSGEQVLRISGHGPLYIFSHQDYHQVKHYGSAVDPFDLYLEFNFVVAVFSV